MANNTEAFEIWYADPRRRLLSVYRKYGVTPYAVWKHANKMEWYAKARVRDEMVRKKTDNLISSKLAEDSSKLYDTLTHLHVHVHNRLKSVDVQAGQSIDPLGLRNLADVIETILRGKRTLAGESATTHTLTFKDFVMGTNGGKPLILNQQIMAAVNILVESGQFGDFLKHEEHPA